MPQRLNAAAAIVCALALSVTVANAKPLRQQQIIVCNQQGCSPSGAGVSLSAKRHAATDGTVIGRRPAGCPHRFCGCEASLYLFGRIIPDLNLAWNWAVRFQRAAPGPRMAAVRHGHVMVIIAHVSGDDYLVHDGNSGGGKTREHVRSIKGYVIVDPQSPRIREARR